MACKRTVYVAAGVNMLIAIVILIVDRLRDPEPVAAEAEAEARSQELPAPGAQSSTYLRLGVAGSLRSLRFRLVGLRKRLDALAHPGHRQFDLFIFDHAGHVSHRPGAGRIYLCAGAGQSRSALEHLRPARAMGRLVGAGDDPAVRTTAADLCPLAARLRRYLHGVSLFADFSRRRW